MSADPVDLSPRYQFDPGNVPRTLLKADLVAFGQLSIAIDRCDSATRKLAYYGCVIRDGAGGITVVPDGDIICPDDADSYIQFDPVTGDLSADATLDDLKIALHIATCADGVLTHVEDIRGVNLNVRVRPGGTAPQVYTKLSDNDWDADWVDPLAAGDATPPPDPIAGAEFIYRADVGIGVADGDPISTWSDQSGNGLDLTAASTVRPIYRGDDGDGLPYVEFDGVNDLLVRTGMTQYAGTDLTLFVVSRGRNIAGSAKILSLSRAGVTPGGGSGTYTLQMNAGVNSIEHRVNGVNYNPIGTPVGGLVRGVGIWNIAAWRAGAFSGRAFYSAWWNMTAAAIDLGASGSQPAWDLTSIGVGGDHINTSNWAAVDVRAIWGYHGKLRDDQMKAMLRYLNFTFKGGAL